MLHEEILFALDRAQVKMSDERRTKLFELALQYAALSPDPAAKSAWLLVQLAELAAP